MWPKICRSTEVWAMSSGICGAGLGSDKTPPTSLSLFECQSKVRKEREWWWELFNPLDLDASQFTRLQLLGFLPRLIQSNRRRMYFSTTHSHCLNFHCRCDWIGSHFCVRGRSDVKTNWQTRLQGDSNLVRLVQVTNLVTRGRSCLLLLWTNGACYLETLCDASSVR